MKSKLKETDLAKKFIDWLNADGWEVYQEVPTGRGTPDIVAKKGKIIWVIETKVSFTLDVMEQAYNWVGHAHFVSVGIPTGVTNHRNQFQFRRKICEMLQIGVLVYDSQYDNPKFPDDHSGIKISLEPKLSRKISTKWEKILKPEMKNFCAAGSQSGQARFTPFRQTVILLIDYVRYHPGTTIKEAVDAIKHHYKKSCTAQTCLVDYIKKGVIKELKIVQSGKKFTLFLKEKV